jgi:high-affinity iron transporter
MITSALLSLREGLEAALIIGILLGALRRAERPDLYRWLWVGIGSAVLTSLATATALRVLDRELEEVMEQIFEAATLLLATGVLTWMIFWMRGESLQLKSRLESEVRWVADMGGRGALCFLAFITVLREGIELALYITAASLTLTGLQTLLGTAIGLSAACLTGYLIYTTALRLNLQRFFKITGLILIMFAAGLIGSSVAELSDAGLIPAIVNPIWNLNPILNDNSAPGIVLATLFGYHGNPSLTEALGYGVYALVTVYAFVKAKKLQPSQLMPGGLPTSPSRRDIGNEPADLTNDPATHHT